MENEGRSIGRPGGPSLPTAVAASGRARPPGAPKPLPKRKHLSHIPPSSIHSEESIYFITICCSPKGENQLCRSAVAEALFESAAFRQQRGDWWIHWLLLMPDHLHALVSFPSNKNMKVVISQWKEFTAKKLAIQWQRDFFEHRLRHDESLRAKADYILQNPVRRGLVGDPQKWPYVWCP